MSGEGVVSEEVAVFLAMFEQLEKCCEGSPKNLGELSATTRSVLELCEKLYAVSTSLRVAELSTPEAFSFPSNVGFQKKWRRYEEQYEQVIFSIVRKNSVAENPVRVPIGQMHPDLRWMVADVIARVHSLKLQSLVLMSVAFPEETKQRLRNMFPDSSDEEGSAEDAWRALTESAGLDPILVLRRRQLIPFVLVPRQGRDKTGITAKLLRNLENAQRSFVFGATLAALVLMRSIMESALRDCYKVRGAKLEQKIDNAAVHFPAGVTAHALHRLRKLANQIVHLGSESRSHRSSQDDIWIQRMSTALYREVDVSETNAERWLEVEVVYLLGVLRKLVEGAPNDQMR